MLFCMNRLAHDHIFRSRFDLVSVAHELFFANRIGSSKLEAGRCAEFSTLVTHYLDWIHYRGDPSSAYRTIRRRTVNHFEL